MNKLSAAIRIILMAVKTAMVALVATLAIGVSAKANVFAPAYLEALPIDSESKTKTLNQKEELLTRIERLERQNYLHDEPLVKTVERLEQRIFQLNGIIEQQNRLLEALTKTR